jgi:hypothetical protein
VTPVPKHVHAFDVESGERLNAAAIAAGATA